MPTLKELDQLDEIRPFVIPIVAFVVWLRQPLWSVPSCVAKAREFWDLIRKG